MTNKNKLYILCGYPFSGKTTLANELVKKLDFVRVDIDEIILENGFISFDNNRITSEKMESMFHQFYQRITRALKQGKNVLSDTSNPTRQGRHILKNLANEVGCSSVIIFVNSSEEIARKRWEENEKVKQRFQITKETLMHAFDEMEKPAVDEAIIEYLPGMNIHTWMTENLLHTSTDLITK